MAETDLYIYLRCNGENGSTTFVDSSVNAFPVTSESLSAHDPSDYLPGFAGDIARISTNYYVEGGSSAYFNPYCVDLIGRTFSRACFLEVSDDDVSQANGEMTIAVDFYSEYPAYTGTQAFEDITFFSRYENAFNYFQFGYTYNSLYGAPALWIKYYHGSYGGHITKYVLWTHTKDTWQNIRIVKDGVNVKFYVDLDQVGGDVTLDVEVPIIQNDPVKIGKISNSSITHDFKWYYDEIKIYGTIVLPEDDDEEVPDEVVCGTVGVVTNSVSNIDHLEGMTVAILADGEVLDQQIVVDGEISLPAYYAQVHIGLPFVSDLETLNIDVPLDDGTLQGKRVKIGCVNLKVMNTRGGWIGPNEDTIYDALTPAIETLAQTTEPTYMLTDDVRVPLGAGYEEGGRLFFRQYDPLPVTINALVPETEVGGAAT